MLYKNLKFLSFELNKNNKQNKEKFCIKYNKDCIQILEMLVLYGFIKKYVICESTRNIFVFLKYYKGRGVLTTFDVFNYKSKKFCIKYHCKKNLLSSKNKFILISNTKYGLLDQYSVVKLNCYGPIIAVIK